MIVALQSMAELERALRGPAPVLIFKHSTACPISAAAYQAFQRFVAAHPAGARYYLVKVIEQRALSGEIARRLGVPHASPQALLWHRGGVRWHASHWAITEQSLAAALAGLRVGGREPAAAPGARAAGTPTAGATSPARPAARWGGRPAAHLEALGGGRAPADATGRPEAGRGAPGGPGNWGASGAGS
ncbi:bacillithiol system redox-active protein YtxJ [Thermaerobacter subterraneus]|uniref:Bacillithiol system protein YtxJ n=1 Tax=Thermaerobacter subterraneus DSM 13965 TaxID=867903 RepID=K6PMH9_9FIRM|nr:bacillithiol system redox-active protein YtxJ [Thermaerobacter subterraneus]EKP94077.1 bacillithiol system protein YtxJ [Thermaerobacter subterraneus DSM 13965]